MSKAEEYQKELDQVECSYDARPKDIISSLRFLVEDMIETIRELEEKAIRTGQNTITNIYTEK